MVRFSVFAHAVGAVALVGATSVLGETLDPDRGESIFGWSVSGSLSAEVAPDYLGAKTYSFGPSAGLQFHRAGVQPTFGAPDDSPGLELLGDNTLSGGIVVRGRSGRNDDDDLRGVHKIDFALEPGVYVEWWPVDGLRIHGEVRHGVLGNSAWSGDGAVDIVHDDARWLLSVGPRLHLGDSRFTRTYFDVSATDAARSPFGIGSYGADGTFVSVGGLASAEYRWSPRWSLLANVSYERILDDAADSPLVGRLGSPDQFGGALGIRYRFGP